MHDTEANWYSQEVKMRLVNIQENIFNLDFFL